jgi:hypothetical protein
MVGLGEDLDGGLLRGRFGRAAFDALEYPIDGVAGGFELVVEFVALVIDPLLEAFEEVAWEVRLIMVGLSVAVDVAQPLDEPLLVMGLAHEQAALVEPGGGPAKGVEEHVTILIVALGRQVSIKMRLNIEKYRRQVIGRD